MQRAFYFDQTRCTGCNTCVVTCKVWNEMKPGKAFLRKLTQTEKGSYPNVSLFNLTMGCNHCENPACKAACPSGAIKKRKEDGIVIVDRNLCMGMRSCVSACPFSAPAVMSGEQETARGNEWKIDHPMLKCHFCWDLLEQGQKPACVAGCPMRALDCGDYYELLKIYPDAVPANSSEVAGFPESTKNPAGTPLPNGDTKPSFLVKVKPFRPVVK